MQKKTCFQMMPFVFASTLVWSCMEKPNLGQETSVLGSGRDQRSQAQQDVETEKNFREIFGALLAESGATREQISYAIYGTPPALFSPPTKAGAGKVANLAAIDEHFMNHTPEDVYRYGQCQSLGTHHLKSGKGPVTLIVFPGFTSEFIPFDPFEEVLANQQSVFAQKMVPILNGLTDSIYQAKDQKTQEVKMSEVVRVASYDRKGVPWVNIMVLTPKLGSMESIGKISSLSEIYARRLHKILHNTRGVDHLGEIYLLGFSRGAATALDFLRHMSAQPTQTYPWFQRVRGLVSLGGVLYGAKAPDRAMSGDDSDDSKTVKYLRKFIADLQGEPPSSLKAQAYATEAAARVTRNMAAWTRVISEMNSIGRGPPKPGSAAALLAAEEAMRKTGDYPEKPGVLSNFDNVKAVLFDLLTMQCPFQCYFQNVRALKQILGGFLDGVGELTTEKRLRWWEEARLSPRFRILSITATMPGAPANGKLSPLLASPYIGYRTPDFVSRLRPGYFSNLEIGVSPLNDSAVSVSRARYWPQLDSVSGRRHDYLGIVGAHHYGIAFPYAVADKNRTANPFPRALLLAAIGSYLREYPYEAKP